MTLPLIDRVYECAFVPALWPGVLDELAGIAGARHGWFCVSGVGNVCWAGSNETARAILRPLAESGWLSRQDRFSRLLSARHAGFLVEHDVYTDKELEADPVYRDLLRPAGLGWAAATAIPLPTGDNLVVCMERDHALGPVEDAVIRQLDALRPHLARGVLLSARLQLEQARMASETLGIIGLPALALDENGKTLAANHLIQALKDYIRWGAGDRIALKDPAANNLLREAIELINHEIGSGAGSFPIRSKDALMVAHLLPIRRSARDVFVRCAAMLVLTPVTRPEAPPVELVQSLFDLTPAEARVARGLASGKTVEDIALAGGTSRNTIRTHVRGVLAKTGCTRQADVVSLLTGVSVARLTLPN